ncbi:MAG: glycosyltransferase [Thermomicrobia bacterium]|nr:glycosyltransferase [Thermomicrobia bacterium]
MKPTVSVVVPTYRRDDLLDRCLAALAAQEFDPSAYEVIICDDAANATTRQLVEAWAARSRAPVRYLPVCGTQGPAAARNRGWRGARGGIIAFTDDDCVPDPGWLRGGVQGFAACGTQEEGQAAEHEDSRLFSPPHRPGRHAGKPATTAIQTIAPFSSARTQRKGRQRPARSVQQRCNALPVTGVCGRIIVPLPPAPTDYERDVAGLERAEFATANCFYRREALDAVGGFDERFTAAWREDADLFFTLLERGDRVAYAPDAVVVHPVRPARWGVSIRQQRKSVFNALLYKKHPALYRDRIQRVPPLHYYGVVAGLLATAIGILRGNRRLTQVGCGLWVVFTERFCARRLHNTARAPRHIVEMAATSIAIPPLSIFWRLRGALRFRALFC